MSAPEERERKRVWWWLFFQQTQHYLCANSLAALFIIICLSNPKPGCVHTHESVSTHLTQAGKINGLYRCGFTRISLFFLAPAISLWSHIWLINLKGKALAHCKKSTTFSVGAAWDNGCYQRLDYIDNLFTGFYKSTGEGKFDFLSSMHACTLSFLSLFSVSLHLFLSVYVCVWMLGRGMVF